MPHRYQQQPTVSFRLGHVPWNFWYRTCQQNRCHLSQPLRDSCCLLGTRGHPRCYTILQISWLASERWSLSGDMEVESVTMHIFKSSLGLVYRAISGSIAGGWGRHLRACGICFTLKPYLSLSIKETGLCCKVSTRFREGKDVARPVGRVRVRDQRIRLIFLDSQPASLFVFWITFWIFFFQISKVIHAHFR